jgi:hypothetical protein
MLGFAARPRPAGRAAPVRFMFGIGRAGISPEPFYAAVYAFHRDAARASIQVALHLVIAHQLI